MDPLSWRATITFQVDPFVKVLWQHHSIEEATWEQEVGSQIWRPNFYKVEGCSVSQLTPHVDYCL